MGSIGVRGCAQRLLLVMLGLGLTLGVVELAVRTVGLSAPASLGPTFDRQVVLFRPQPARTNPWSRGAEDVLRLAVIGDSFTVGETNLVYDAYPARLRWLLNLNAGVPPAEVLVFARRGLATVDQIPLLRRALTFAPDLILFGMTLNDPELPGSAEQQAMRDATIPRPPPASLAPLLRRSRALTLIHQRLERLRVARARSAYGAFLYDPQGEGWRTFERSLKTAARLGRRHDVPVLAALFPTMHGLADGYDLAPGHAQMGAALEAAGIPYLDLMLAFVGRSDTRMSAFDEIDAHPSEIAHRLAATEIFAWLLDEGHVDHAYRPQTTYVERSRDQWLTLTRRMRDAATP